MLPEHRNAVLLHRLVGEDKFALIGDRPRLVSVPVECTVAEFTEKVQQHCSHFAQSQSQDPQLTWVQPSGTSFADISSRSGESVLCEKLDLQEGTLRFVAVDWTKEHWDADVDLEAFGALEVDPSVRRAQTMQRMGRVRAFPATTEVLQAKQAQTVSMADCFELFEAPSILDENNTWYCPECKTHVEGSQQLQLWSAPEVPDDLCIRLECVCRCLLCS